MANEEVTTGCLGDLKDASPIRPGWVHAQTRLGRSERRSPTSCRFQRRTWREANATSASEHHFRENTVLTGLLAVTFRTRVQQHPLRTSLRLISEHFRTLVLESRGSHCQWWKPGARAASPVLEGFRRRAVVQENNGQGCAGSPQALARDEKQDRGTVPGLQMPLGFG